MSLANLPDVLIAHLCTYLDYDDVCNLMETSKKNYNAIKAYKKDKIKLDSLTFNHYDDGDHEAVINSEDGQAKRYKCNIYDKNKTSLYNVESLLKECSYVGKINLVRYVITSNLAKVLFKTKANIGKVGMERGGVCLDVEEFVKFCQKFRGSELRTSSIMLPSNVWTDDVLIKLIEASTEISFFDLGAPNTTAQLITDRTLKALFRENPYTKYFHLGDFHNSFTIKELVNSLIILKESNSKSLNYHLGILQSDQIDDAERYFNKETGELRNEYCINSWNNGHHTQYEVYVGLGFYRNYSNELGKTPRIWFEVLH